MLKTKVQDIMAEHVVKIPESATIMQAAHILLRFRINGVLITSHTDRDNVLGVITTTDLLRLLDKALSKPRNKKAELEKMAMKKVGQVAKKQVLSVTKDTKIEKVVALMHKKKIHTIPVYDGEKLVGVVGRHDIFNIAFYKD